MPRLPKSKEIRQNGFSAISGPRVLPGPISSPISQCGAVRCGVARCAKQSAKKRLWGLTLLFAPVADMGPIYVGSALVLGAVFLALAERVRRDPDPKTAMTLFGWSITYVTLLFGAMAVDEVVRHGF